MSFVLATVPYMGTRTVVSRLDLRGGGIPTNPDGVVPEGRTTIWGHIEDENMEWLTNTPLQIFSTWRDPLQAAISYVVRNRSDRPPAAEYFKRLLELRRRRTIAFLDLRFFSKGFESKHHPLKTAYAEKDIRAIERIMPDELQAMREISWGDFPTEGWWR